MDYAMLIEVYHNPSDGEARYSPPEVKSVEMVPVRGNPDPKRIGTSIVERSDLSAGMGCRRFTRLTNGFGRKWENLHLLTRCSVNIFIWVPVRIEID